MKKSTDRSSHYKGNAIIETALETDETLEQVRADMHTLRQIALIRQLKEYERVK